MRVIVAATLYVAVVIAIAAAAGRSALAVYVLSFWHYGLYALAFFWRQIPLGAFKSDALLLKSISLAALTAVLVATPPGPFVLVALAAGFGLNAVAAWRLGSDRTYYGYELADLPPRRVIAFPYSVTAHPMLFGNMGAYGVLLLDGALREHWWPLAVGHVALNALLLAMERRGSENPRAGMLWLCCGFTLGAALLLLAYQDVWPFAVAALAASTGFAMLLFRRYTRTPRHDLLAQRPS